MQISAIDMRRGTFAIVAAAALGGLAAATIAVPTASAQPGCTAAGLSSTLGSVSTATGQYLAAHPGADDAITNSGALAPGDAENAIRVYFVAHPQEWADLQGIARPLATLRQQCDVDVAPAQIARLFDAMAS
jgi:hemophore-related protein